MLVKSFPGLLIFAEDFVSKFRYGFCKFAWHTDDAIAIRNNNVTRMYENAAYRDGLVYGFKFVPSRTDAPAA